MRVIDLANRTLTVAKPEVDMRARTVQIDIIAAQPEH